jgi:hypothetical protein
MEKILLFNEQGTTASIGDAAHDVAGYPVSKFRGFTNLGTTDTELEMVFDSMEDANDLVLYDNVKLTITANKHLSVMADIWRAIHGGPHSDGVITIFDAEDTTTKVSSDITGITITVATNA